MEEAGPGEEALITSKQSGEGISRGITYLPTCTQLQVSRTSLPHPYSLFPCPPATQPCREGQGEPTPPPLFSAHLKGTRARQEPTVCSVLA